jgi:hypothetical protein
MRRAQVNLYYTEQARRLSKLGEEFGGILNSLVSGNSESSSLFHAAMGVNALG